MVNMEMVDANIAKQLQRSIERNSKLTILLEKADELYAAFVSVKDPTPGQREALDEWAKASNDYRRG